VAEIRHNITDLHKWSPTFVLASVQHQ